MNADTPREASPSPSPLSSDDITLTQTSVFSLDQNWIDAQESDLSDYPDDLPQCSEARADPREEQNPKDVHKEPITNASPPSAPFIGNFSVPGNRHLVGHLEYARFEAADQPSNDKSGASLLDGVLRDAASRTSSIMSGEAENREFTAFAGTVPHDVGPSSNALPCDLAPLPMYSTYVEESEPFTQLQSLQPARKATPTTMTQTTKPKATKATPEASGWRKSGRDTAKADAPEKRRLSIGDAPEKRQKIASFLPHLRRGGAATPERPTPEPLTPEPPTPAALASELSSMEISTSAETRVKPSLIVKLKCPFPQATPGPVRRRSARLRNRVAAKAPQEDISLFQDEVYFHQTRDKFDIDLAKEKADVQPSQDKIVGDKIDGDMPQVHGNAKMPKHSVDTERPQDTSSLIVKLKKALPATTLDRPIQPQPKGLEGTLETISRSLINMSHRPNKPNPVHQPEVWADTRHELCETLPYFRAYNAAMYATGGFAYGFMFDKEASCRDYTDSNVIISRAGGGMVKDKEGNMVLGGDQTQGTATQSIRNCMQNYNPVVMITGVDNPTMPCKPPHTYCVLDYFKPTHIWYEKSKGKTIVRHRFEKLCLKKRSWWQVEEDPVSLGGLSPPTVKECDACKVESPQVYLQGWMCLQPSCKAYWKISGTEPHEAELLYDPRFLKQKTVWPNDDQDHPLKPSDITLSSHAIPGEDCSRAHWAGIVCPHCGRCTLRLAWSAWECPCGYRKEPPHALIPAKAIRDPFFPISRAYTPSRNVHVPTVGLEVSFKHNYRINKYTIPGVDGFVVHLVANKSIIEEACGPDEMFEELQTIEIGLRRRPLDPSRETKGGGITRHFTVNYGMPYKFIVAPASHSFDGAARPITASRSRLNWASKLLVPEHREFNEVLALGYYEEQRINYHDDGEFGLGPTIATLSLGATGKMRLRMKATHYHGASNAGVFNDAPPKPGCYKYEERLGVMDELATLKNSGNGAEYRARLKTLPKELELKRAGNARDAITMTLGHGDIVIMHGAEIQKYYEHSVEHAGKLRFALTCRYIDPKSLKDADKPTYVVGPDTGFYDGSKL